MTKNREALADAAQTLAGMLAANADMLDTTMQSLTCSEAEVLVDLVALAGYEDEAALLREAHAETDEPGDWHVEDDEEGDL